MAINDSMATKLMKIESEIDEARLRADYSGAIPTLLKKWRKLMATPSTILEDVIHAETCLYSILNKPCSPIPWVSFHSYPPAIHPSFIHLAKPTLSSSDLSLLMEATESVARAYTALLQSQQLPVQIHSESGLPSCSNKEIQVKTLFANSQLYLEIIVIKCEILMLRGFYKECLTILETEIELPSFLSTQPNPSMSTIFTNEKKVEESVPSTPLIKGIGIIYLAMAYTLKAECLYFTHVNSPLNSTNSPDTGSYFSPLSPSTTSSATTTTTTTTAAAATTTVTNTSTTTTTPLSLMSPFFPASSAQYLHSLLSFFNDVAPTDVELITHPTPSSLTSTNLLEPKVPRMMVSQNSYPFTLPIPELVIQSPHWTLVVYHGLFWGCMIWLQAWFLQIQSLTLFTSSSSSSSSSSFSFPYQLSFPVLTYQTLAFIRSFFHVCTSHFPSTEKPSLSSFFLSKSSTSIKHPRECILVASWAIRFLVIWTYVVVQKETSLNFPLVVDYLPMLDPTGYYQAGTLDQELEILFHLWFKAILVLHPFPKANVKNLPFAVVNLVMEELIATLEWSDVFLVMKPFSIKFIETSLKHTFHSLLCLRILAMSHFRAGEVQHGFTILQRYKEIAKEQLPMNQEFISHDPLYYPKLELSLRSLFKNLKIGSLSMFLTQPEGLEAFMELMINGSIKLAEHHHFQKAMETIDFAKSMVKPNDQLSPSLMAKLNDALGSILSALAQTTLDPEERATSLERAKDALNASIHAKSDPSFHVYYQLALLAAEQRNLNEAKFQVKLALKKNKAHVPSWHLLALLLTASREYENAIRIIEVGIRESISFHLPTPVSMDSKLTTYDLVCMLARDQQLNESWTALNYEAFLLALFKLKLTQSKILEVKKGPESALAIVHDLFRWYKVLFEEEIQIQDIVRLRSESVSSVNSNWLISSFSDKFQVKLQARRKRTLLTKAFLPTFTEVDMDPTIEERHRLNSSHSIHSLAKAIQKNHILAHLWLRMGQILVFTSHTSETQRALIEIEGNLKHDMALYSDVGYLYYLLSQPEKALECWHKALTRHPWDVTALLGLAKYHFDMQQMDEASLILNDLTLTSGHDCIDAWYFLGKIHKEQGNLEMANTCFLKALELQKVEPIYPFRTLPRLSLTSFIEASN